MNILISGGTGLISTAITRLLLERGDDVTHFNRGRLDLYPVPAQVAQVHGDRTESPVPIPTHARPAEPNRRSLAATTARIASTAPRIRSSRSGRAPVATPAASASR